MSKEQINDTSKIENALEQLYQSPEPSGEFLDTLETRLEQAHSQTSSDQAGASKQRRPIRWAAVPALIVLALALVVAALGPQNVLAQVQALIGYVPGVGFVDVNDTRVLLEPVSQTKDGITVTVKQVMVGPEETYLVLSVDGLEPPEQLLEGYWPKGPDQDIMEWHERYQALWESDGRLILPDGTEVYGTNYQGAPWDGYYTMPTLPADVLTVQFEVTRLPGVPADKAPQGWSFELELGYVANAPAPPNVGDENYTADNVPSVLLPEATPVGEVSEAFEGISLEVVDVVYAETETSIRLSIENIPLDWRYRTIDLYGVLTDDLGNEYMSIYGPVIGLQSDGTFILNFDPILPEASSLTLTVDHVSLVLMLEGKFVHVDFGDAPQLDSTIPMDSTLNILGTQLHFNAVNIRSGQVVYTPDETPIISLDFNLDPIHVEGNLTVTGIMFASEATQILGANFGVMGGGGGGGGGGGEDENTYYFYPSLGFPADLPLPTGSYDLPIGEAQVNVTGPFVISWDVP